MTKKPPSNTLRNIAVTYFGLASLTPILVFTFVAHQHELLFEAPIQALLGFSLLVAVFGFARFMQTLGQITALAEQVHDWGKKGLREVSVASTGPELLEAARLRRGLNVMRKVALTPDRDKPPPYQVEIPNDLMRQLRGEDEEPSS